ncbi:MAG: MFS transporter [Phycisphaerae bacterium]
MIAEPAEIRRVYAHYRLRILIWATVGYAFFYFVRKNLSVAMPEMEQELGVSKVSLGVFLTLHGVLYGVSKFANGFLGDRANARVFMALGLLTSAAMNFCFGLSTAAIALGVFWMINGWFQGMGFPPCARLMTHWFSPKELATKMSIWNTSHSIGAAGVLVLCGYLVAYDWRLCFFVPAALAVLMACMLLIWLRDTPESVGLPGIEGTGTAFEAANGTSGKGEFRSVLARKVFGNPFIWLFSLANVFVYTIRYGVLDWGPTILKEAKGIEVSHGSWMTAGFEAAGLPGILLTGWLTDRVFGGRPSRMCLVFMLLCGFALFAFWKAPPHHVAMNTALLMTAGFFIYGPQALVGIAAANLATKQAAATAVGLTGIFGYASTVLSGWGLGWLAQHHGWDAVFKGLILVAAIGTLCFAATWRAKPHGYDETT